MIERTRRDWPAAAWTLVWPGLGHLHQGRNRACLLFSLWTLALAVGVHAAPALGVPQALLWAELVGVGLLALADVLRARP
jgi:hypothetical protein